MNRLVKISPLVQEVKLRNNPVIVRVNKFTEDSAKKFSEEISIAHNTGQSIIPVVIDSYGGQVYSLMSMISTIKNASLPIATVIEGKAMSCGAVLFSFGADKLRFMSRDSTLMIHDVSSGMSGKIEEIKADADEADRLNKGVYEMMAQNCGHKKSYFLDLVHDKGHADWFLDAAEAKRHNLANHIKVPNLSISINVDINVK